MKQRRPESNTGGSRTVTERGGKCFFFFGSLVLEVAEITSLELKELGGCSRNFPEFQAISRKVRERPGSSRNFQKVLGNSKVLVELPGSSWMFQEAR